MKVQSNVEYPVSFHTVTDGDLVRDEEIPHTEILAMGGGSRSPGYRET